MPRILVIQGANMDILGVRQPEIYGTTTAEQLNAMIEEHCALRGVDIEIFYTNSEAELMRRAWQAPADGFDVLVCNTGSFCYGSYAIRDCFGSMSIPVIEVHMTNQLTRGIHSVTAAGAKALIMGFGYNSYLIAIDAAAFLVQKSQSASL